ncbi:MAG: (d)CMP kinase [Rhodothermales bacterium]
MIVALDGPAGSGKTSTAKAVAGALDFAYLDTGAMYRAVTLASLESGKEITELMVSELAAEISVDIRYKAGVMHVFLNGREVTQALRSEAVNENVSLVSSFGVVRSRMVAAQREIANRIVAEGGGVVIDGRDIGTVVFPEAPVKVFMNASPEVRARRRKEELDAQGMPANEQEILENIKFRDNFDSTRAIAPLRKADDAIALDTSVLSFEEQVSRVVNIVKERQVRSDV